MLYVRLTCYRVSEEHTINVTSAFQTSQEAVQFDITEKSENEYSCGSKNFNFFCCTTACCYGIYLSIKLISSTNIDTNTQNETTIALKVKTRTRAEKSYHQKLFKNEINRLRI